MNTLSTLYDTLVFFVVHPQYRICEDPCGIDHHSRIDLVFFSVDHVHCLNTIYKTVIILYQAGYFHIVQCDTAFIRSSLGQVYCQPGIIKLSVVINGPAKQSFRLSPI